MHSRLRKRTVERRTCRRNSKPYLTYRTKAQERTPRPFLQPSYASRLRSDLLGARASSRIRKATKTLAKLSEGQQTPGSKAIKFSTVRHVFLSAPSVA